MRYTGTSKRRACSHSCNSVFASLLQLAMSVVAMISPNMRWTIARAASNPPSRKVAPMTASSASARIDARSAPPPRASPSDRCSTSGRPSDSATLCKLSSRTRWARTRVKSPSSEPAKRSNSRLEIARLNTASPRNSSRSLWSAPKLRCVSARSSGPSWVKRYPMRDCNASRRESMVMRIGLARLRLGAAFVFDQNEHRLHHFHFDVVGEADHDPVVFLGDLQVFAGDRLDGVLDFFLLLERVSNLGHRRHALGRNLVDRFLNGQVLVDRRQHPHEQQREETNDDGP